MWTYIPCLNPDWETASGTARWLPFSRCPVSLFATIVSMVLQIQGVKDMLKINIQKNDVALGAL